MLSPQAYHGGVSEANEHLFLYCANTEKLALGRPGEGRSPTRSQLSQEQPLEAQCTRAHNQKVSVYNT